MGYRRAKATFVLKFEDDTFEGLEVRCHSVSVNDFVQVMALTEGGIPIRPETKNKLEEVLAIFLDSFIEWNLEDEEGEPIEATVESILNLDRAFLTRLIDSWIEGLVSVPGPLSRRSPNGVPSLVESLPMEALSESQAS